MSRAIKRKRDDIPLDPVEVDIDDSEDESSNKRESPRDPESKRRKLSEVASELELNGVVVPKPSNSKPIPEKYLKLLGDQANETTPPEVQCCICLDAVNTPTLMSDCEHVFCWVCIDQWTKQANNCPACRKEAKWIKTKFVMADGPNKGKQDVKHFNKKHDNRMENYIDQLSEEDIQRILGDDIQPQRLVIPSLLGLASFTFRGTMRVQRADVIINNFS